jgi:hypothetical protein
MEVNSLRSWKLCAMPRTIALNCRGIVQHESAILPVSTGGLTPYLTPFYNFRNLSNLI